MGVSYLPKSGLALRVLCRSSGVIVPTREWGGAMILFFYGFATGVLLAMCVLLELGRSQPPESDEGAVEHSERWRDRNPLPPC